MLPDFLEGPCLGCALHTVCTIWLLPYIKKRVEKDEIKSDGQEMAVIIGANFVSPVVQSCDWMHTVSTKSLKQGSRQQMIIYCCTRNL